MKLGFHAICCTLVITTVCKTVTSDSQQVASQWQGECNTLQSPISEVVNGLSSRIMSVIDDKGNIFFSPFCISVALGMAYLGAGGKTAQEMEQALGYDSLLPSGQNNGTGFDPFIVHNAIKDELRSLENHSDDISMLVANAMFKQIGYDVRASYVKELKSIYNAKLRDADFIFDGMGTVWEINEWVKENTNGKIDHLFEDPLNPLTRLILLNAIYFKGFWEKPFDESMTRPRRFYNTNGGSKPVLFMISHRKFNCFEDRERTGYSFLEIDYKGDHISMILMLPIDLNAFPDLEVTNSLLCHVRSGFVRQRVLVIIPKFHMEYERELSDDLRSLGVVELFSEGKANMTGISAENDLNLSLIKHKAVIDVHEKGTEAAGVSSVVTTLRSGLTMPVFRADHPFLFCILDKRSGTILFMGRVVDP